jgi:2-iminobutanoate/2-iminopropanoate deaminase
MRRTIHSENAPAAIGPYSQAVQGAGLLWVSGQIALDPRTGQLMPGGIEEQTRRALDNLREILEAGGSGFDQALRLTVYLVDIGEFAAFNQVYAEYFPENPPARVCVEVSALPKGARVEIDAVAMVS